MSNKIIVSGRVLQILIDQPTLSEHQRFDCVYFEEALAAVLKDLNLANTYNYDTFRLLSHSKNAKEVKEFGSIFHHILLFLQDKWQREA